ncbi:transcriptional regulator [Opitutaceae bacterium TAV1]|nr:transcriptional regulator [Opitutaceae bacterium TAV1]
MNTRSSLTTRDLARQLGLSVATVSRALSNAVDVSAATRERVRAFARQAGYRPNALVNALMTQVRQHQRLQPTGEVVAYLTSFATENDWRRHPSHMQQFEGAEQRAREFGFTLRPMWLGPSGIQSRAAARILHARGIRGSLLAPLPATHHTLHLDWEHHATVAIGFSLRQVAPNRVAHDHMHIAFSCYLNLRKLGYARIGLVIPEADNTRGKHLWSTGVLGCQFIHGGRRIPPCLLPDYETPQPFHDWFEHHRPDALIGIWQDFPLRWLRERGVRVPEEVGYATLDVGGRLGQLAGMKQANHDLGMAAVDLLAGQLFRNETGLPQTPTVTQIEGTWEDGPTVRRQ